METTFKRIREVVQRALSAKGMTNRKEKLTGPLFRSILEELKIKMIMTEFEADLSMAKFAVFSKVKWIKVDGVRALKKTKGGITGLVFNRQKFLDKCIIDDKRFRLFAAILGNDYIEPKLGDISNMIKGRRYDLASDEEVVL